ncbi:uncharacterized protein [Rutidosis leptorrhynchoides]|uniref:uncharacterized protein n=1 Tax=Rutidosis leptorrhynchoides TaxID=125765 RepID=UPI003A99FCB4
MEMKTLKFFHASIRRKYNKCNFCGFTVNGVWTEDPAEVKDTLYAHFQKLFTKNAGCRPKLVGCTIPDGPNMSNGSDSSAGSGCFRLSYSESAELEAHFSEEIWKVIHHLVGFEQSDFIRGRNIIDGALIANESLEFLKHNKLRSMVFKVDFEKGFDSLNWEFLEEMMGFMGFGVKWRSWIASCLKSASISVLVNGSPTKEFKLGRGYADDTIFFDTWSVVNIENLMKLLKRFELSSGIKVNHNKSNLFGVGVDNNEVEIWLIFLVVSVLEKLECVRCKFFWGGSGDESKISWVKWDDVIRPLGSLNYKILALIGKWWWMFKTETTSLWVNVIKSIYGASRSLNSDGFNSLSCSNSTWSKIVKTSFEIDDIGVDIFKSFSKAIGNGNNTKFWDEVWIKDKPLKEVFARLVRLESNANASVEDRLCYNGKKCVPTWCWLHEVSGRTKGEQGELELLLSSLVMVPGKDDSWVWKLSGSNKFSTQSLTKHIMSSFYPPNASNMV